MKPEIRDELMRMGSTLINGPDDMPYITPPGYFVGMARRMARTAADAPPADYFDTLPQRIKTRLAEEGETATSSTQTKTRRIILPAIRHWAAAAVLVLFVGIGGVLLFTPQAPVRSPADPLAAVPDEAIAQWAADWGADDVTPGMQQSRSAPVVDPLAGIPASEIQAYLDATL